MTVYLFSSDGYWDSVDRKRYATSIDEVRQMAVAHELYYGNEVDQSSFYEDEKKREVGYKYWDPSGRLCSGSCHYILLTPFQP